MTPDPDVSVPHAVLAAVTVGVVFVIGFAAVTTGTPFSAYNDDWDGASTLRSIATETDTRVVTTAESTAYETTPANGTVAIVLDPDRFSKREIFRMESFVERGGTLVVAGDFDSQVNRLLQAIGASARLNGSLVRDSRFYYRTPTMPIARNVADRPPVTDVDSLTLNYGTVVEPRGATVLVNTSAYAYVDANRNGTLDRNERLGSYPVATSERLGDGRVVVVSDSSVFINSMLDRPGNRQFVLGLVSGSERLLLVQPPDRLPAALLAVYAIRQSTALTFGFGLLVLAPFVVLSGAWTPSLSLPSRGLPSFRTDTPDGEARPDREELAAVLEDEHPEWDRDRIDRIVSAIESRRNE